jgi:hypothetical protein
MAALASIAIYNVVELAFIILTTFKRRRGLYFYSFITATAGIVPYTLGFMSKFFNIIPQTMISITMLVIGWCLMVTGQSLVLYSRLHLVVQNSRTLHFVLAMIMFNAFICHIPIIVLAYGANSNNPGPYITPYSIYEKVQITIFFMQEVIISGIYIYSSANILKPAGNIQARSIRTAMTHLISINVIIVVMDLTLLATEYAGHYEIQVIYKAALYSIKLKMEFRILTQLVALTKSSNPREWSRGPADGCQQPHSSSEKISRKFEQMMQPEMTAFSDRHVVEVSGGYGNQQQEPKDDGNITMENERVIQYIVPASRAYPSTRRHTDFVVREERTIDREKVPWSGHDCEKWAESVSQGDQVEGIGRSISERSLKAGFSKIYRMSQLKSGG